MTPGEARKLLGGYATGSLTEAERTALFQAALGDQDLFDELAGEQLLKEVLDEPGARQRLLVALEPPRQRAWLWATAATMAIAVVIGIVVGTSVHKRTPPPPPPQQIAQVLKPPEPVASQLPAQPPLSPKRKVAPTPTAAPVPPPELKKEENGAVADQIQEATPQAAAGALRQFAPARAVSVFAFNYTVGADGFLEITPAARGFLSAMARDAVVFPSTMVNPGTAVRFAIPPGTPSLVVVFSAMPGITGTPVRRDETSGTVTDQDPPNGKILIQLFLKLETR